MPRTRRSKKYKRKTIKRKGGNPFLKNEVKLVKRLVPAARKLTENLVPQIGQTTYNIATENSNLESPPTSAPLKTHYKAPPLSYISPLDKLKYSIKQSDNAIPKNVSVKPGYLASTTSILSATSPLGKPNDTIKQSDKVISKNVSVKPGYLASTGIKVKALTRGLTAFSYPSLARILITNISAKSNAEYLTTQYIRNIISLFAPILEAALDDIIIADVSVSEKVVKSIITDETLSPGDIKTTLVNVLAKHLQIIAPELKKELGKTKFVDVSPEFMKIIQPYLDALFNDLKEELSAIIIRKLTNAVDKLKVDNIKEEWQTKKEKLQKKIEEKFKPAFDEFVKSSYSDKIKMMYSYSRLSYNNTMATFNEHKEPQKQAGSKPKIRITDFAKDWYSSTQELLNIWYEKKLQNQNVLTINVLLSAIDLSIPTLIDEYCNYWNPNALCNKQQIQAKFSKIMKEFREFWANYENKDWEEFREFDATYEKKDWSDFSDLEKSLDKKV
jgi:hypothetical protein